VPIAAPICQGGDAGQPIAIADPQALPSQVFQQIASGLHQTFQPAAIDG
jgi:hypothetical protein